VNRVLLIVALILLAFGIVVTVQGWLFGTVVFNPKLRDIEPVILHLKITGVPDSSVAPKLEVLVPYAVSGPTITEKNGWGKLSFTGKLFKTRIDNTGDVIEVDVKLPFWFARSYRRFPVIVRYDKWWGYTWVDPFDIRDDKKATVEVEVSKHDGYFTYYWVGSFTGKDYYWVNVTYEGDLKATLVYYAVPMYFTYSYDTDETLYKMSIGEVTLRLYVSRLGPEGPVMYGPPDTKDYAHCYRLVPVVSVEVVEDDGTKQSKTLTLLDGSDTFNIRVKDKTLYINDWKICQLQETPQEPPDGQPGGDEPEPPDDNDGVNDTTPPKLPVPEWAGPPIIAIALTLLVIALIL